MGPKAACSCEKKLAAGEGVEPSVSAFKAQRVAGYTIPQKHCRFPIGDCRLKTSRCSLPANWQLEIAKSAMSLVAVEGIEPTSLDYRSSALAVELHRERRSLDFGLRALI